MASFGDERYCVGGEDRSHNVYKFTDSIYKIVQFYRDRSIRIEGYDRSQEKHYDFKLDASLSRSRRVLLEIALCNPWEYFCTFTQDEEKRCRSDLKSFHSDLSQFIRDQRKKGFPIKFVFVPETHEDGSWHVHGLLSGIPAGSLELFKDMDKRGYRSSAGRRLPVKLRKSNFFNWSAYQSKFGYCSLGKIINPVAAAFYITKYITKDSERMVKEVGLQSYWASRPLNHAELHVSFFGRDPAIDSLLNNKYDFCATGMTHQKQGYDWSFCMDYLDFDAMEPLEVETFDAVQEVEEYSDFEQLVLNL